MKMYDEYDVRSIVQDFLAEHFGFEFVYLNYESIDKLECICANYGIEVEHIASNR